jgi:CHAT domain-containing protein/tetratricopeptide (TPR) repeat protein
LLWAAVWLLHAETTLLEPGKKIERDLKGGESHEYRIALQAGDYARVWVEQSSVNVAVTCTAPSSDVVFDDDNYAVGDIENAELIATAPGEYRLRVTSPDPTAPAGKYQITLRTVEAVTTQDQSRVAAMRAYAQGVKCYKPGTQEAFVKAISHFEEALTNWRAARAAFEEAATLATMGMTYAQMGQRQKAFDHANQAVLRAQASDDRRIEGWTLVDLGAVLNNFGDKKKAIEVCKRARTFMRAVEDRLGEGAACNCLGRGYFQSGETRKGLSYFERTVQISLEIHDRTTLAAVRNNLGIVYSSLGEYQRALENYELSLEWQRASANSTGEALALNNLGSAYWEMGEYQKSLDSHMAALAISERLGFRAQRMTNLHNVASVHYSLGDTQRALRFYQEAIALGREINDPYRLGGSLNNIGLIYADLGDQRRALECYTEALKFRRAVSDLEGEATTLTNLGKTYRKLGDQEKARDSLDRAVEILRRSGNRRRLASALLAFGDLYRETGDRERTLASLEEALEIARAIHDRRNEADTLGRLARMELDAGNLAKSREWADQAIAVVESIRFSVASPKFRASFFAAEREIEELEIDLLMRLHAQQPQKGFDVAALSASEAGRARSLLDLLAESGAEIRRGVDRTLLDRESELQRLIAGKAEQQTRILSSKHSETEAAATQRELDSMGADLEQVQSRIRESSPQYVALKRPETLAVHEIQTKVLDDETILLEYALGAGKSFLWVVTCTSVDAFELPPRTAIEAVAKRVLELARMQRTDDALVTAAAEATHMLLDPAAKRIANKRLLIVGEGVLQLLPFGALPEPGAAKNGVAPLIVNHEIVTAPSASVIAVLRQQVAGRQPAPKAIAILADPVFSPDDARIESVSRPRTNGATDFVRLRFSRHEADEIARLAPAGSTLKAVDFDASRERVMSNDLSEYRIVHFATHSILDNTHPELSGVVLSLVDRDGRPRNGFLRLYDIYNLRLNSDLVVLSACQTALGEDVRGEGVIGLTRGFLYAGAPRVLSTLWEIDDRTTAELMKQFYTGILARGERPAAALRAAQIALWKSKCWDAPYYWGAFTLQGEWR